MHASGRGLLVSAGPAACVSAVAVPRLARAALPAIRITSARCKGPGGRRRQEEEQDARQHQTGLTSLVHPWRPWRSTTGIRSSGGSGGEGPGQRKQPGPLVPRLPSRPIRRRSSVTGPGPAPSSLLGLARADVAILRPTGGRGWVPCRQIGRQMSSSRQSVGEPVPPMRAPARGRPRARSVARRSRGSANLRFRGAMGRAVRVDVGRPSGTSVTAWIRARPSSWAAAARRGRPARLGRERGERAQRPRGWTSGPSGRRVKRRRPRPPERHVRR